MVSYRYWLAIVSFVAVGCQPDNPAPRVAGSTADGTSSSAAPVPISLALNWFPEAEHGGFYAALVHGYFADEGLHVTIRPGGPKAPVIPEVADGRIKDKAANSPAVSALSGWDDSRS